MLQNFIHAVVLDSSPTHGIKTAWFLILLRVIGGLGKISYVCQFMAYAVTPKPERTALSILTAIVTNLGLCLGPLMASCVLHMQGGSAAIPSIYTRASTPVYVMATLWAILGVFVAACQP